MVNGIGPQNQVGFNNNFFTNGTQPINQVNNNQNQSVFADTNTAQFKTDTAQLNQDKQEIMNLIQAAKTDPEARRELMSLQPQPINNSNDSNAQLQNEITYMLIQAQMMCANEQNNQQGQTLNLEA